MKIFVSVGRIATQEQKVFLERLEAKLRNAGLDPRSIGRNTFASHEPLERVKELMRKCRGLIVVAFERTIVERGRETRGLGKDPLEFRDRRYGTPWHEGWQIEHASHSQLFPKHLPHICSGQVTGRSKIQRNSTPSQPTVPIRIRRQILLVSLSPLEESATEIARLHQRCSEPRAPVGS